MNATNTHTRTAKGTHRRTWRTTLYLTILGSLVLTTAAALPSAANADVKVRARVETPNLSIRVGNGPHRPYAHVDYDWRYDRHRFPRPILRPNLRVKRDHHAYRYQITRKDRKIAKRLARWTGWSKREILELRRDGYRWREIGRILDIPRRVVRAAVQGKRGWREYDDDHSYGHCEYDDD